MAAGRTKILGALNWPNRISFFRLLGIVPFVVLLIYQRQWGPPARYAALALFVAMGLSDFLDGRLARRLHLCTRLGAILDPLADKTLIICAVVLLALPASAMPGAPLSAWVVVLVVGKDLWVMVGFVVTVLVTNRFRVHPTVAGKACTVGQFVMVSFFLVAPDLNALCEPLGTRIAQGLSWGAAALSLLAAVSYTRLGLEFIGQAQKPLEDAGGRPPRRDEAP